MPERATLTCPDVRRRRDAFGRPIRWGDLRGEVRSEDGARRFHGEAIVFDSPTWIGSAKYGFREQIAPGAVTETLAEDDVRFLINHNPDLLLARNTSGTLRLRATTKALEVDAALPDVSYASDLAVLLERQDISQMSFAFEPLAWTIEELDDGNRSYTITKLRLYDVSVVTYPAYKDTSADLRAAQRRSDTARMARASLAIASARILEETR